MIKPDNVINQRKQHNTLPTPKGVIKKGVIKIDD